MKHLFRPLCRLTILASSMLIGAGLAAPVGASTLSVVHSTSFAGYGASLAGTVTTFSGTMSVPTVTCPATGNTTLEPEVTLDTAGQFIAFFDSINCSGGVASPAFVFASVFPITGGYDTASATLSPAAGDTVRMQLTIAKGKVTVKISDAKGGTSGSATAPVTGTLTSIDAGTSVYGNTPNVVPTFTTISFGSLKLGAAALSTLSPTEYAIYNGSTRQVSTSTITAGGSFHNTFVHS
jgi:hypothetical protein